MAVNYSANQFEQQFKAQALCNWEIPKWTQQVYPKARKSVTKIIANDRGHLLPGVVRANQQLSSNHKQKINPWSNFKNTWQLPNKILTKEKAFELAGVPLKPQFTGPRWVRKTKQQKNQKPNGKKGGKCFLPDCGGDQRETETNLDCNLVDDEAISQHPSRSNLVTEREIKSSQNQEELHIKGNDLNLEDRDCKGFEKFKERKLKIPNLCGNDITEEEEDEMMKYFIPDKPTEREDSSPLIPAYCNFQMAKKMAQENLEHQPLPDAVMDRAYRKWQSTGALNPGLALDDMPVATGVGIKNYKAGPTQCTKMRVYRPKTSGITPSPLDKSKMFGRPQTSICSKKMGAMDLAICWDYRPMDPRDEPQRPAHIDGSNGSVAPAVFTLVKTPRTPDEQQNTGGRTGGVFSSTLGQENFFEKDILKRNTQFGDKHADCRCDNLESSFRRSRAGPEENRCVDGGQRPRSMTRDGAQMNNYAMMQKALYKSSPNLSEMVRKSDESVRESENRCQLVCIKHTVPTIVEPKKHHHHHHRSQPNLTNQKSQKKFYKTNRLCQRNTNQEERITVPKQEYKQAFRAGIPNSNASGTCSSFDSGCSSMSSNSVCSVVQPPKQIKVPKPRDPYAKKNYNIDTLAPPFACWRGGAGQGGYPEHWRLASVYQHSYKPIDQRKRLLATVFQ